MRGGSPAAARASWYRTAVRESPLKSASCRSENCSRSASSRCAFKREIVRLRGPSLQLSLGVHSARWLRASSKDVLHTFWRQLRRTGDLSQGVTILPRCSDPAVALLEGMVEPRRALHQRVRRRLRHPTRLILDSFGREPTASWSRTTTGDSSGALSGPTPAIAATAGVSAKLKPRSSNCVTQGSSIRYRMKLPSRRDATTPRSTRRCS